MPSSADVTSNIQYYSIEQTVGRNFTLKINSCWKITREKFTTPQITRKNLQITREKWNHEVSFFSSGEF